MTLLQRVITKCQRADVVVIVKEVSQRVCVYVC